MNAKLNKYQKIDRAVLKVSYLVAMIIFAAIIIWGGVKLIDFYRYEETNDAQVKEYINPILSRTSGFVQEIRYSDHQKIFKGDTLVILDRNEALVRLKEANAEIASASAQIRVIESSINAAQSSAKINEAKINAAKAQLWNQQQNYDRYKSLLSAEAVTQQQYEDVKTQLDIASANYEAIKNTFINSQDKIADEKARLEVAKANLEQKRSLLGEIQLNLQYSVIIAPSDGIVGSRSIQEGQYIQKGQVIGFMVDKSQGKWVIANFMETQITEMYKGQKAEIEVDAFPGESFKGIVESFSPATGSQFSLLPPDNATGNFVKITQRFPVKITFVGENPLIERLKAGMNAEVSIIKD